MLYNIVSLSMLLLWRGADGYETGLILTPEDKTLLDLPHRIVSSMGLHTRAGPIDVPSSLNWAEKGYMNPVKSQGACGSCWAFAAADAQSSRDAIKNGLLHDISEKHFLDCTYDKHPRWDACRGGSSDTAWHEISRRGVAGQQFYRPYNRKDEKCPSDTEFDRLNYKRVSWTGTHQNDNNVHKYLTNKHELKEELTKYGPCVMYMGADRAFNLLNKDSGVWRCNPNHQIDHAITVVGFGQTNGENYWMIKNSWGTGWGDGGYAKVSMDHCKMGSRTGVMFLCPEVRRLNAESCTGPTDQSWNWENDYSSGNNKITLLSPSKAAEIASDIKRGHSVSVDSDVALRIQRDGSEHYSHIKYIRADTGEQETFVFRGGYTDHTRVETIGNVCEMGCNVCGYNWYEKHWNNGNPTYWHGRYCGCCKGSQAQQNVCKKVCIKDYEPEKSDYTKIRCTGNPNSHRCNSLPFGQEVPVIITELNLDPRRGSAHANQWQRNQFTFTGSKYKVCSGPCAGLSDQSWTWNSYFGAGDYKITLLSSDKAAEIANNIKNKGFKYYVDTDVTMHVRRDDSQSDSYIKYIRTDTGEQETFVFRGGYADHTNVEIVDGGQKIQCNANRHRTLYRCNSLVEGEAVAAIITEVYFYPRSGSASGNKWSRNRFTWTGTKYRVCSGQSRNEADASCSAHTKCQHLEGSCCPTNDGVFLDCCSA